MGINAGSFFSPLLTGWLASVVTDTPLQQNYKVVFAAAGVGMVLSYLWFWFGRRQLQGIGRPPAERRRCTCARPRRDHRVTGCRSYTCCWPRSVRTRWRGFSACCSSRLAVMLLVEGARQGKVARDKVIAMLIIFVFNVLFWMFFEQAGSSFNFLAEKIVHRDVR